MICSSAVGVLPAVREIDTSYVLCVGLPWLDCKAMGIVFAGFLERVIHAPLSSLDCLEHGVQVRGNQDSSCKAGKVFELCDRAYYGGGLK